MTQKQFSADVEQLIQLVTHSIYSNKEIFLRELISNSNDAIQKAKLKSIKDTDYLGDDHELKIQIDINEKKKIITISDNWIWMTPTEIEKNLWIIAKSWTKDFLDKLKKQKESKSNELIWQFGIGFYSVFMVAEKVEVETKSKESKSASLRTSNWRWTYEISNSDKSTRWTTIKIYLNKDSEEFANLEKIKELIKKHSNYIPVPILTKKTEFKDWKTIQLDEYEQTNAMTSIWNKQKSLVKKEEYLSFYKDNYFDQNEPLDHIHINIEWAINYNAIIYIPQEKNPFENMMSTDDQYWLSLYVQNVLIMDKCQDLLPKWLRFVKWVVQTNDLPLNVSREILQNSQVINKIQHSIVKEVIKSLSYQLKNNPKYDNFLKNFGIHIKEGIHMDFENKEKLWWLIKYYSLNEEKNITFDQYIEKAIKDQKNIYYIIWNSIQELKSNPHVKSFKKNEFDALLMDSHIDERIISSLAKYKDFELKSIKSSEVSQQTEEQKKEIETKTSENKDFLAYSQSQLPAEKVDKVEFTQQDEDILWILKTPEWQPSIQMEQIMKSMWNPTPNTKRILELNINNLKIKSAIEKHKSDSKSSDLQDFVKYVYEQAILSEWGNLENINDFISRANKLVNF